MATANAYTDALAYARRNHRKLPDAPDVLKERLVKGHPVSVLREHTFRCPRCQTLRCNSGRGTPCSCEEHRSPA